LTCNYALEPVLTAMLYNGNIVNIKPGYYCCTRWRHNLVAGVDGHFAVNYPCSSCKEIRDYDHKMPSGEYSIKTPSGKILNNVSV